MEPAKPDASLVGHTPQTYFPGKGCMCSALLGDLVTCECCGAYITEANPKTNPCDCCGRMRCCRCDMGRNTVCPDCEEQ